jgi:tetratricopeptide (TPR) repeat protein
MELDPSDDNAKRSYTQAEISLGEVEPAIQMWKHWSDEHPHDAASPAMLGMLYEASGDNGPAMEAYERSLRIEPNQPIACNNLAYLIVENKGNLDRALALAQTAHQRMPASADTTDTLAWVYFQKGSYEQALDLLKQAAGQDEANASVQFHLGMTLSRLNRKAEAADHLRRASTLSNDPALAQDAQRELNRLG